MEQIPSFEEVLGTQLVKIFPAFYGTKRPITVITTASRWILS